MSTDIFISYASEDTSKAMELVHLLQGDGWSVWWDREISPGQDFEIEIDMALANARAVVVLWSVFSVSSNWVRNEAKEAKETNKLIPVILDDARIPLTYRSLSTIDLRRWPDNQCLLELSMFKSAVSRVLLTGVSEQMLKRPSATEEMSLSVRVASRVADMVADREKHDSGAGNHDSSLAIERCFTDIFLDILNTAPDSMDARIDAYLMQLANTLGAPTVIRNKVDFSRMSVTDIRSMGLGKVTAIQEKCILEYVNQYCSSEGEHNLSLSDQEWPVGRLLCLPLPPKTGEREFTWFISETAKPAWKQDTQDRLLKLASGLQAGAIRAR